MKRILYVVGFLSLVVLGCFEPPQYSDVPKIRMESARFENPKTGDDTLEIKFTFTDGNGDLGLSSTNPDDIEPPFNRQWYFLLTENPQCEEGAGKPCKKKSFLDEANLGNYVTYRDRRETPGYDTLPPYEAPYNCLNYEIKKNDLNQPIDTFYFQANKRYLNIFMNIYTKESTPGGAVFVLLDPNKLYNNNCFLEGLNGRFQILDKEGNPDSNTPVSGTFTYKYRSPQLIPILGNKTVKVSIQIVDRDGNFSNIVESEEFPIK